MVSGAIPIQVVQRAARYLHYLRKLPPDSPKYISATMIAAALDIYDVIVRKDLAMISGDGKKKVGYSRMDLIEDITHFLGYDDSTEAVIAGVGNLGKALLCYRNFEKYGMRIVAAFDTDPCLIDAEIGGIKIIDAAKIENLCLRLNAKIGVITVPEAAAQDVCDAMIRGGIGAIWNFAPIELKVPQGIALKSEDMAASLAILNKRYQKEKNSLGGT